MAPPPYSSAFRFPATRPELPSITQWMPFVQEAYEANWFTNFGSLSRRLERKLIEAWGFESTTCVLTSSGTAAIAAPLIARNITGLVLLPAFTFPATLSAVRMAGASPLLIDVCSDDWRVSPNLLRKALAESGAEAAIVVCPFGMKSDFSEHAKIAEEFGVTLIIDNAAGLGVTRENVEAAPHVFEAYSMHATKPFGIGEGGSVFAHRDHDRALRRAINFGLPLGPIPQQPNWGLNGKLSEFHAAVGLAVMQDFTSRLQARRKFAARYAAALSRFPEVRFSDAASESSWQVFPVLMPAPYSAEKFVDVARGRGMEIRRYYRPSLSASLGVEAATSCAASEFLAERMCCLPVYSVFCENEEEEMLEIVVSALGSALAGGDR